MQYEITQMQYFFVHLCLFIFAFSHSAWLVAPQYETQDNSWGCQNFAPKKSDILTIASYRTRFGGGGKLIFFSDSDERRCDDSAVLLQT